jgi:hypothetical protein
MNLRNHKPIHEYDIIVDRRNILGNPFYMKDESQRHQVCVNYANWLIDNKEKDKIYKELLRLVNIYSKYNKLRLFCWCAPKQCHAEIIKEWILDYITQN